MAMFLANEYESCVTENIAYLKPLQLLQNRELMSIYGPPFMYSMSELYALTNMLPIKGLYYYQVVFLKTACF